jgi:hypothetical protein
MDGGVVKSVRVRGFLNILFVRIVLDTPELILYGIEEMAFVTGRRVQSSDLPS